jgi:hypothetical protein
MTDTPVNRDIDTLVRFEVAIRNVTAMSAGALDVATRRYQSLPYADAALPMVNWMTRCRFWRLLEATQRLREALEVEQEG